MDSTPPPPYDAKGADTDIDIEAQLPPSMTLVTSTPPKYSTNTTCTCCPVHPHACQFPLVQSPHISAPVRQTTYTTNTTPETTSSDDDGNDAASAFFWLFLIFLGLGIWLTITGRIGHVKWKLGVGITFVVLSVACLIGCICSFDVEAAERVDRGGEEED